MKISTLDKSLVIKEKEAVSKPVEFLFNNVLKPFNNDLASAKVITSFRTKVSSNRQVRKIC